MNKSSDNLEASRLKVRFESILNQELNTRFDVIDIRRERNERGAVQVRSIAGNINYATMGANDGNTTVGP